LYITAENAKHAEKRKYYESQVYTFDKMEGTYVGELQRSFGKKRTSLTRSGRASSKLKVA